MTKTEPRSAGSGGGREKTTPTELLALADEMRHPSYDDHKFGTNYITREAVTRWSERLRTLATTLSAREDGWQPIETAPNVGNFLVAIRGSVFPAYRYGGVLQNDCTHEPFIEAPSWWRQYPAAPKAPTAGEGQCK